MKSVFTLLTFFFIINESYAQIDRQWYIVNGVNNGNVVGSGSMFSLEGVSHPAPLLSSNQDNVPRNDIFIIYDNLEYFNSRYMPNYGSSYTSGSNYCLNSSSIYDIIYLYFTNLYEGPDWPPSSVSITSVSPVSCNYSGLTIDPDLDVMAPFNPIGMSLNHDFVPGSDVTIIIDKDEVGGSECLMQLCYNIHESDVVEIFRPSSIFQGDLDNPNPSFILPRNINYTIEPGSNCIVFRNTLNNNTFINFRVTVDQDLNYSYMNSAFEFELTPVNDNNASCQSYTVTDTLRPSHDPNFVELESICEDNNGDVFLTYYIQCYNDGNPEYGGIRFEDVSLPSSITPISNLTILDWSINGVSNMLNTPDHDMLEPSSNLNLPLTFEFPMGQSLDTDSIAFVRFCVKTNTDLDELMDYENNLAIGVPNSTFGVSGTYPITSFFDIPCNLSAKDRSRCAREIDHSQNCCEMSESPCPYHPIICWIIELFSSWWMIGFLSFLILGGYILRSINKTD